MADEITAETQKPKKKFFTKKKIYIVLFIGVLSVSGAGTYWYFFSGKRMPALSKIQLDKKTQHFVFSQLPDLFASIVSIDEEILMIEAEIERIKSIETIYPNQKKITETEQKEWEKLLKNLKSTLAKSEPAIEAIYVTIRVNPEKGTTLIETSAPELKKSIDEALKNSKVLTDKLRAIEAAKGIMDILKEQIDSLMN